MDMTIELVAIPVTDVDRASDVDVRPWGNFVSFSDPTATPGRCKSSRLAVGTPVPTGTVMDVSLPGGQSRIV
jgi:hypothetical protein